MLKNKTGLKKRERRKPVWTKKTKKNWAREEEEKPVDLFSLQEVQNYKKRLLHNFVAVLGNRSVSFNLRLEVSTPRLMRMVRQQFSKLRIYRSWGRGCIAQS